MEPVSKVLRGTVTSLSAHEFPSRSVSTEGILLSMSESVSTVDPLICTGSAWKLISMRWMCSDGIVAQQCITTRHTFLIRPCKLIFSKLHERVTIMMAYIYKQGTGTQGIS